jgi:hypothetical protein
VTRSVLLHDFDETHLWLQVRLVEGILLKAAEGAGVRPATVTGVSKRSELLERIAAADPREPAVAVIDLRRDDHDQVFHGARLVETILWHGRLRPRAHVVVLTAWATPAVMAYFARFSVNGFQIAGFIGGRNLARLGNAAADALFGDLLRRRVEPRRPVFAVAEGDATDYHTALDAAIVRKGLTPSPALHELLAAWSEGVVRMVDLEERLADRRVRARGAVRGFVEEVERRLGEHPGVPRDAAGRVNGPRLALDLYAKYPLPELGQVRDADLLGPLQAAALVRDRELMRRAWVDEQALSTLEAVLLRTVPNRSPSAWRRAAAGAFPNDAEQRGQAVIRALLALRAAAEEPA